MPFVAKATGVPLAMVASGSCWASPWPTSARKACCRYAVGQVRMLDHVSVKEAVLPFDRFPGVDTLLGPEMRSTGEVMGIDITFGLAFAKSQLAAGTRLPDSGTVFLSLADRDKPTGLEVARLFADSASPSPPRWGRPASCGPPGLEVDTLVAKVGEEGVASDAVDYRAGQGAAGREHATRPWAAGRRQAHPRHHGRLQGSLPHHAGRGAGRRRRHGRHAVASARWCGRCRTCTRWAKDAPG